MIRLDNISKQNGQRLVFIEASAALQKGEKIGLVGPNGAGKTTLFRMITGEEEPDEGQILVDRGVSIGLFSQDVGEMAGRSAVAEVMDGAGAVSAVAAELAVLEVALADPAQADRMDAILERFGDVQARFNLTDDGMAKTIEICVKVGGCDQRVGARGNNNAVFPLLGYDDDGNSGGAVADGDARGIHAGAFKMLAQLLAKGVVAKTSNHRDRVAESRDGNGLIRAFAARMDLKVGAHHCFADRRNDLR